MTSGGQRVTVQLSGEDLSMMRIGVQLARQKLIDDGEAAVQRAKSAHHLAQLRGADRPALEAERDAALRDAAAARAAAANLSRVLEQLVAQVEVTAPER